MAILGIGVDVIEVSRIQEAVRRYGDRFVERILTAAERQNSTHVARLAGRWAAKEAVAKASGIDLAWHDIEIFNDERGAPFVVPSERASSLGHCRIHLSISHEKGIAAAVAVVESP